MWITFSILRGTNGTGSSSTAFDLEIFIMSIYEGYQLVGRGLHPISQENYYEADMMYISSVSMGGLHYPSHI
jgi:hypothetical protein